MVSWDMVFFNVVGHSIQMTTGQTIDAAFYVKLQAEMLDLFTNTDAGSVAARAWYIIFLPAPYV